jgi:hypothetical protein
VFDVVNSLWMLDMSTPTWTWNLVMPNGTVGDFVPSPRRRAAGTIVSNYFIVHGGYLDANNAVHDQRYDYIFGTHVSGAIYFYNMCIGKWVAPITSLDGKKLDCSPLDTPGSTTEKSKKSSGLGAGAITGIVIGCLCTVGIFVVGVWIKQSHNIKKEECKDDNDVSERSMVNSLYRNEQDEEIIIVAHPNPVV